MNANVSFSDSSNTLFQVVRTQLHQTVMIYELCFCGNLRERNSTTVFRCSLDNIIPGVLRYTKQPQNIARESPKSKQTEKF